MLTKYRKWAAVRPSALKKLNGKILTSVAIFKPNNDLKTLFALKFILDPNWLIIRRSGVTSRIPPDYMRDPMTVIRKIDIQVSI